MIPTRTNCLDAARAYLGDESADTYTDTILAPYLANAFRKLTVAGLRVQHPKMRRVGFYNVPINTSTLDPSTAGLSHFGAPSMVEERSTTTVATITGAVTGTGLWTITAAGHGFSTGYSIQQYGITGPTIDINDEYTITVSSSSVYTVNGCVATGTYTSGGTATYSTDSWTEVPMVALLDELPLTPSATLTQVAYRGGQFKFFPATGIRQVRITYWMSGDVPTTGANSMGIDGSLEFLAMYTAALAAQSRGEGSTAAAFLALSTGGSVDGEGGALGDFLAPAIRANNSIPIQRPPYRYPRRFATSF